MTTTHHRMQPGSQKGRSLQPGDTIGIVAPSGPMTAEALADGLERFHSWGYKTVVGEHVLARHGYLAGTDAQRAADFNAIWAHPDVDGVLCAKGGYGTMRMLDAINWDLVRERPMFFGGFSDITAVHAAMEQRAGLITFHCPMVTGFGAAVAYNAGGLVRALQSSAPLGVVPWPESGPDGPVPVVVRPGVAEGRLAGGNLSLIASLMGTPFEPDFTGRILILEDIEEPPYRMDRMLIQLLLAGKLQTAAGILFGDSPTCMNGPEGRSSLTLMQVLDELVVPLGIPVLYGFPCGHTGYRATLPLGAMARLDAAAGSLTVLEAALV